LYATWILKMNNTNTFKRLLEKGEANIGLYQTLDEIQRKKEMPSLRYLLYGVLMKIAEVIKFLFGGTNLEQKTISQKTLNGILQGYAKQKREGEFDLWGVIQ